jgi:mannose-6-phosphate isomerase-like protein (cupin superfamily)
MRLIVIVLALAALAREADTADAQSLTAAQVAEAIRKLPATPPTNANLFSEAHYIVAIATVRHRIQSAEVHENQDRVFYVIEGSGELRVGGQLRLAQGASTTQSNSSELEGYHSISLSPGTVISVPRGRPYQFAAEHTELSFLVVRVLQ